MEGVYPNGDRLAENFLLRRTAGNGLELVGILTFRASPVWVMAALADVSGAGRQLISEIANSLKQAGLLAADAEVSTVEQMLDGLERTAGRVAETVNTPPLDIPALRKEWADIRGELASIPTPNLPSAEDVWRRWREITEEAARQQRSVWELSSLMALGAVTRLPDNLRWLGRSAALATRRTGELFAGALLDHYRQALTEIRETGYLRYLIREFRPYLKAAALQFSPKRVSLTQRLLRRGSPLLICCAVALGTLEAQEPAKRPAPFRPKPVAVAALRSHVSFLAADTMQGRNTPSHELDIAAEYIAAQFRRIGLEPPAESGYFQTTQGETSVRLGQTKLSLPKDSITGSLPQVTLARLYKITSLEGISGQQTASRAIVTTPELARQLHERRRELRPYIILAVAAGPADRPEGVVTIRDSQFAEAFQKLPEGRTDAVITSMPAGLKNVMGVLRGANPVLRDQYVLVTAHYDHVGVRPDGEGDRIFNGANDNASGVASVIEAAASLSASAVKPKRSIVFMTFFGEEKGLVGARYYASNPVFPIEKTVAQINLEQTGRTDDSKGPRIGAAFLTGFDFSQLGEILRAASASVGIKLENSPSGDEFFNRSDNEALAAVGVPAHTLGVAFMFPDYHQPGDEWQKIDYENMAKVTRAIAAGALAVANRSEPPRWLRTNPKAEPFLREATLLAKPPEVSAPVSGNSPASRRPRKSAR